MPRRTFRRGTMIAAAACALGACVTVVLGPGSARAASGTSRLPQVSFGPLTLVSRGLPYHSGLCASGNIANRDSAVEPTIASDPSDPNRLLAAWFAAPDYNGLQQAGITNLASGSDDGGRHWRLSEARGVSACAGGTEPTAADPAVAVARDGNSYFLSVGAHFVSGIPASRIAVFRFDSTGRPASGPTYVPTPRGYNDRPTITADPSTPRRLYVVSVFHGGKTTALGGGQDSVLLARSEDRSRHWSARVIYRPPTGDDLWGTQVFAAGRGRLVITYWTINGSDWTIDALHSSDGGRDWGGPIRIASLTPGIIGASGTNTSAPWARGTLAAAGPGGSVYVVWGNNTPDGRGHVFVTRTSDGGRSWTLPDTVADLACETMLPAIAVDHNGTLGVTYYAFRRCAAGTAPVTDVWFAASRNLGAPWQRNHLAGPFDLRSVLNLTFKPGTGDEIPGRFLGDYTGLSTMGHGFGAIMILPKPYARYGRQDAFFRRVTLR